MKHDVIDHMAIGITSKLIKQAKLERAVLESILQVIEEEAEEARNTFAGDNYIKNEKRKIKQAYLLWAQQKKTNKSKKEIYDYIATCIGDVHPRTIEGYIESFTKGYNPTRRYDANIL